jgi:pimeloyl-ACP methyl ester carboxylesterase
VAVAIAMPKLGMTMAEGTVVAWQAHVGERVSKGGPLLLIESEKAEVAIESPSDGLLRHIYVDAGAVVPCGTLLAALTATEEEAFDADAFRNANEHALTVPSPLLSSVPAPHAGATATRAGGLGVAAPQAPVTPAARRRAKDLDVDAAKVPGSGPGGRVTVGDVEAYATRMAARVTVDDDVALDVQSSGNGHTLVLLPGFGTDTSAFAPHIPELAKSLRVLAVNPRGVGFSDAPDTERYDIARAAEDVARVVANAGPAHVVGASMGAAIAIELALAHPDQVASLVLITPFVRVSARLSALTEAWVAAASVGAGMVAATILPWMFSEDFLSDDGRRLRATRSIAQTSGRIDARVLARWTAGIRSWSGTRENALAHIATPTMVIAAGDDLLTPGAAEVAATIPGAKLLRVENAGHAVAIENPSVITRAILEHCG